MLIDEYRLRIAQALALDPTSEQQHATDEFCRFLTDFHPQSVVYAVRYAWKDDPKDANVRSLSGLPMSSFELKINK